MRVADFGLSRLYHGMHTMTGGLGTFQVSCIVLQAAAAKRVGDPSMAGTLSQSCQLHYIIFVGYPGGGGAALVWSTCTCV